MSLLSIAVLNIHCNKTTKEIDRDEPYVLVTSAMTGLLGNVETVKYGPWAKVNKGDTVSTLARLPGMDDNSWKIISAGKVVRTLFWGINGKPAALTNTQDVIFIVSMAEHDHSADANATREAVKLAALGTMTSSVGMDYQTRVTKLIQDIDDAMQIPTGAPNFDDPIGTSKHLALSITDLSGTPGTTRNKTLSFAGEKGDYTVTCQITYS